MKQSIVAAFFSLALAVPALAQTRSDRDQDSLFGQVHVVQVATAKILEGQERMKQSIGATCYDKSGNRVLFQNKISIANEGKGNKRQTGYGESGEKIVYTYDAQGKILEGAVYEKGNGASSLQWTQLYDSQGRLSVKIAYGGSGLGTKDVFTYNEKGYLIKDIQYDITRGAGAPTAMSTCSYDDKGRLTEKGFYTFDKDEEVFQAREDYMYDVDGNLSEVVASDGKGVNKTTLTYREYQLEPKGNWVRRVVSKTIQDKSGTHQEPDEVVYRAFRYYDSR